MREKSEVLHIRVTPQVKQEIKQRMEYFGVDNMTDYITKMALLGEIQKLDFNLSTIDAMCYELNKIGNNLNQITKICNQTRNIDVSNVVKIQQDLILKLDENYSQIGKLIKKINKEMRVLNGNN